MIQDVSGRVFNQGFAICKGVLAPEQVAMYRAEAYRLYEAEQYAASQGTRMHDADYKMYTEYGDHIFNLARKTRVFDSLYEHPLVTSVLESVMKNKFILTQTEMRRPKRGAVAGSANVYHRDGRLLVDADLWVTAFWLLEDATLENGPTTVIPRSHKREIASEAAEDEAVTLTAQAGDLIFMNANLLHKASASKNNSSRWVLIITYNQWFLKPAVDHTRYFKRVDVDAMTPMLQQLFGFTSFPPFDERKRMYTCRPWSEIADEMNFPQ